MKACKRPLGRGADDGATVKGSSCDKERGDLVEPRTVRLVVLGRSGCGCRYRSYHPIFFFGIRGRSGEVRLVVVYTMASSSSV